MKRRMMKKRTVKMRMLKMRATFKKVRQSFIAKEEGEGFVDVLVKMLIVVIVGAALLAIMQTAIPGLFSSMIDKVKDIFDV